MRRTPTSSTGAAGPRKFGPDSSGITSDPWDGTCQPGSTSSTRSGTDAGRTPISPSTRTGSGTRWHCLPRRRRSGSDGPSSGPWTTPSWECFARATDAHGMHLRAPPYEARCRGGARDLGPRLRALRSARALGARRRSMVQSSGMTTGSSGTSALRRALRIGGLVLGLLAVVAFGLAAWLTLAVPDEPGSIADDIGESVSGLGAIGIGAGALFFLAGFLPRR